MDIESFLQDQGVQFEVIPHEQAFSAQEVAATEHVTGHIFAKTVIASGGGDTYMLVLPASRHVDFQKASAAAGCELMMVGEDEMKSLFPDSQIGAEPPFGSQYGLQTIVDEHLAEQGQIVFRGCSHDRTIKMSYADYERLENPTVAPLAI
ncbi:MAG: YbaK/EbsC family protein [Planctomycetes bacterium]|nr:YbaK/EbsC family protein [Planctomycetota bacterium]